MPTPLPRPGPTDYQDAPGTELDLVWDELCDVVEATEATANAALPATQAAAGTLIAAAASKATPVDADSLALSDSAAGGILRRFSWASLKAALNGVFARLAGVSGGQTLIGGTASGENLTLQSTAHATRGKLLLGTSAYDEAANRLGIGVSSPTAALHLRAGSASANTAPLKLQDGPLLTTPEAGAIEQQSGRLYHTDAAAARNAIATEAFATSKTSSLITNGFGELGSNRNWSNFSFDQIDTYQGTNGAFSINVSAAIRKTDEQFALDPTRRLSISIVAKSGNIGGGSYNPANKQYCGLEFYDIDGLLIGPEHADKYPGSQETNLAAPLVSGDTTITLSSATGWYASGTSTYRSLTWFGYTNSKGYVYPDFTYSRNRLENAWDAGGISGNVITLRAPWAGPNLPAGAAVRNSWNGETIRYSVMNVVSVPDTWTTYSGYVQGYGFQSNNIRFGAASARLAFYLNYHGAADNQIRFTAASAHYVSASNLESQFGIGATYRILQPSSLPTNGLAVEGKIGCGTNTPSAQIHAIAGTEQCRLGYDASTYVSQSVASAGQYSIALTGTAANAKLSYSDAATAAVYDLLTLAKNSSGAGAAGLGVRIVLAAKSSTTSDTPQGAVDASWATATHASRKGRLSLSAYDTAIREGLRVEASGSAPMLGFFGAAAVTKPTALTATVAAAPAGGTGTAAGGWDTSANRDLAITTINNLKTRVDQLESRLQALGLLS